MALLLLVTVAVFVWLCARCYRYGLGGVVTYLAGFLLLLSLAIGLPLELRPLAQVCAWSAAAWIFAVPAWWVHKSLRRRVR